MPRKIPSKTLTALTELPDANAKCGCGHTRDKHYHFRESKIVGTHGIFNVLELKELRGLTCFVQGCPCEQYQPGPVGAWLKPRRRQKHMAAV